MTFTLTLAQAVTEAVTVNYVTSDGTATAGQDYTAVTSGEATIPANSTSATFTVSVTGDTTDEANETFNVTISLPEPEPDLNGSGNGEHPVAISGGATATAAGTIMDDDPVVVTVAPKAASVVEGQDAVFVLTRAGVTDGALSIRVRLRAPGRVETLSAEFDAAATTTELSRLQPRTTTWWTTPPRTTTPSKSSATGTSMAGMTPSILPETRMRPR